jgi:hypothetical protein
MIKKVLIHCKKRIHGYFQFLWEKQQGLLQVRISEGQRKNII